MAWVRFDDGFFRHPKVVTAGRDARDLYMASVFYANSNLTDGFIPEGALRLIAADAGINSYTKAVRALTEVRLWVVGDGGYQIHDYLKYQASAESVTTSREANAKRQEEYRNRRRNAGSNGKSNAVTNAPVTDPPINIPNTFSNEKETPKPPKPKVEDDPRFIEFWDSYPKKLARQDAIRAFAKVDWRKVEFANMMAALSQHKMSEQWTKDNGEFIPYPATWLNKCRWTDDLKPAVAPKPAPTIAEPRGYSQDPDEADRQMKRDLEELQRRALGGGEGQIISLRRGA